MRINRLLQHRCTVVETDVVTGQDPYGRDIYEDRSVPNVPCRVDQIRKRATTDEYGTDYVTQNMVFLGRKTKIKRGYKMRDFKDKHGNSIIDGVYEIDRITPVYKRKSLSHFEVTLTEGS